MLYLENEWQEGSPPACAGSTVNEAHLWQIFEDHPRLRGEYCKEWSARCRRSGSPPLARGVQPDRTGSRCHFRITPACAGSTDDSGLSLCSPQDHPRLRGEYYTCGTSSMTSPGSPPLARGVPSQEPRSRDQEGITPACAGSTQLLFL